MGPFVLNSLTVKKSTLYIKGEVNGSFKKSSEGSRKNEQDTARCGVSVKGKNHKQVSRLQV